LPTPSPSGRSRCCCTGRRGERPRDADRLSGATY
jgi:hypothetical protein